jgi:hypothetical protein
VRVYTSYAGLPRPVLRIVHGILSGLWVVLSTTGFIIMVYFKTDNGYPQFLSYAPCLFSPPPTTDTSDPLKRRLHSRLGLGVLFFSFIQGVAGTLKLFVLFATNKVTLPRPI